MRNTKFSIKMA